MDWKQQVWDVVEQLKAEREHANDPARVLEAIICRCADVAATVEGWGVPQLGELAIQLKESAIKLYASSASPSSVRALLERTIVGIADCVVLSPPS